MRRLYEKIVMLGPLFERPDSNPVYYIIKNVGSSCSRPSANPLIRDAPGLSPGGRDGRCAGGYWLGPFSLKLALVSTIRYRP